MSTAAILHTPGSATQEKTITLLGSTGTIGVNTLRIVDSQPGYRIAAMTAGSNVAKLIEQARRHRPERAVIADESHYDTLKSALAGTGIEAAAGHKAVADAAAAPADIVMSAIVGAAALTPTLAAIRGGKIVALANKECLVCAGELVMKEAARHNATIIPVDSEHSAIFQLMNADNAPFVERVTITASGGPFRAWSTQQMKAVTPEQAVRHPNWAMGAKISVDSATLMNKGLELIEAYHLFPLSAEQLGILVHPQSIVHCLVQMQDGSVLAQMSNPDMCTPIACALAWPSRIPAPVAKLDLAAIGTLEFARPDEARFPAVRLAREALLAGGSAPTILNAANEVAVNRFLNGEIGFLDIVAVVEKTLEALPRRTPASLDDITACDAEARRFAQIIQNNHWV